MNVQMDDAENIVFRQEISNMHGLVNLYTLCVYIYRESECYSDNIFNSFEDGQGPL